MNMLYGKHLRYLNFMELSDGEELTKPVLPDLSSLNIEYNYDLTYPDPYQYEYITFTQKKIDKYRELVDNYPEWHTSIGYYPTPNWLNELSNKISKRPLWFTEEKLAESICILNQEILSVLEVRTICLALLKGQGTDPLSLLKRTLEKGIDSPKYYLLAIAKKLGYEVPPEKVELVKVTTVQRPWSVEEPDWLTQDIDKDYYLQETCADNSIDYPNLENYIDIMDRLRKNISIARTKGMERKQAKWKR